MLSGQGGNSTTKSLSNCQMGNMSAQRHQFLRQNSDGVSEVQPEMPARKQASPISEDAHAEGVPYTGHLGVGEDVTSPWPEALLSCGRHHHPRASHRPYQLKVYLQQHSHCMHNSLTSIFQKLNHHSNALQAAEDSNSSASVVVLQPEHTSKSSDPA